MSLFNFFNRKNSSNYRKILAVGVIIEDEKQRILLHKRQKSPSKGSWEYMAGYVDPFESLEKACRRVVWQMTRIMHLRNLKFTGKFYDNPNRHPNKSCIPLIFSAKINSKHLEETSNLKWFLLKDIPKLKFALDNKKIIIDYLNSKPTKDSSQ